MMRIRVKIKITPAFTLLLYFYSSIIYLFVQITITNLKLEENGTTLYTFKAIRKPYNTLFHLQAGHYTTFCYKISNALL